MSIRPVPSQRMDRTPQVVGWRAAESRRAAQQSGRPRRRGQAFQGTNTSRRIPPGRGGQEHEEVATDGQ